MILVEQHQYPKLSKHFKELDNLCFLSKNLYNVTLYHVRQHYFENKEYLGYSKINSISNELFPKDYQALPRKVSQQVQKLVDQNFKSFFAHIKSRKAGERIDIPNYLHKEKGRQVLTYTNQAISFNNRNVPSGYVKLSGVSFMIRTKVDNVQFARIVPKSNYIVIEIGYEVSEDCFNKNNRFASIDIGVNNLATLTSNVFRPIIINGKPIKSINQYYNKFISNESSRNNNKWTNRMYSITRKRNNKIKDYMHKSSRFIVNQLVENRVSTLVIGHNDGWKQDTNLKKNVQQNFIHIPFNTFISMLKYKCKIHGINVVLQEESYTSKCSFLDQDLMPVYSKQDTVLKVSGKRIHRGLYKNSNGYTINADVNGSLNILRKYLINQEAWNEKIFSDCVEVCSAPSVYTVKL